MAERRPLATRDRAFAMRVTGALARTGISPNGISMLSMLFGLLAGIAFVATTHVAGGGTRVAWIAGAAFIQLRLLANMFDGMVALETGQTSPVGELFNEAPDRFSDIVILVGAGYATGGHVALGFVAALLAVCVAYVRALGVAAGAAQAFGGPMAKPHRMFVLTICALYCGIVSPGRAMTIALSIVAAGCVVTLVLRLRRIGAELRG